MTVHISYFYKINVNRFKQGQPLAWREMMELRGSNWKEVYPEVSNGRSEAPAGLLWQHKDDYRTIKEHIGTSRKNWKVVFFFKKERTSSHLDLATNLLETRQRGKIITNYKTNCVYMLTASRAFWAAPTWKSEVEKCLKIGTFWNFKFDVD